VQSARLPPAVKQRLEAQLAADATGDAAAMVRAALAGHNADRALIALDAVDQVASRSQQAAQRLGPDLRLALIRGVAERRTPAANGEAGILGVEQARRAAEAVAAMPEAQFIQLGVLLSNAGGDLAAGASASADAERALLLKAAGARAEVLRASRSDEIAQQRGQVSMTQAERAMAELGDFAAGIRGAPRDSLIRSTTALDLEPDQNTSASDPLAMLGADARSDNDGLYQRYESTCGPTTAQMARAEADPIFARRLWTDAGDPTGDSATAKQQLSMLNAVYFFDGRNPDREIHLRRPELASFRATGDLPPGILLERGETTLRLANQRRAEVARLAKASHLPDESQRELGRWLAGGELAAKPLRSAAQALEAVRRANGGSPTEAEVALMRQSPVRAEAGMRAELALNALARGATGTTYRWRPVDFAGRRPLPPKAALVDEVASHLERGRSVAISLGSPNLPGGHFLLMSDVRGQGAEQRFLVSDPFSGRTAWVSRGELRDPKSGWPRKHFELGWTQLTGFHTE
jgi:hypothetical protein